MKPIDRLRDLLSEIDRKQRELDSLKAKLDQINDALGSILGNGTEISGLKFAGLKMQPAILALLGERQEPLNAVQIKDELMAGGFQNEGKPEYLNTNIYIACKRLLQRGKIADGGKVKGKYAFRIPQHQ